MTLCLMNSQGHLFKGVRYSKCSCLVVNMKMNAIC